MPTPMAETDRFADLDARIAEILFKIRRGEAPDVGELLQELDQLRRQQAALDRKTQDRQLAEHLELVLG